MSTLAVVAPGVVRYWHSFLVVDRMLAKSRCSVSTLAKLYAALLHKLPLAGGLTRLSFNPVVNRLFFGAVGPVEAVMRNGVRITVDPQDYHGRILYLFGTNDPKVQATAVSLLRPEDTFLDIGANYSTIGLHAARVVGPNGSVHLFEPQPALCERITSAIDSAGIHNVRLHPIGLMDRDAELELARPAHHSGMASFEPQFDEEGWKRQTVTVREIGTYLAPLVGDSPFGVKLDVEGVEPLLIPWLVAQPNLQFLIFEAAHHHDELWAMTRGAGLTVYGLERRVFAKRLARVDDVAGLGRHHDLVAVPWRRHENAPRRIGVVSLGRLLRDQA